jgi:hypothetical protein
MALSDLVAALKAVNPFNSRSLLRSLSNLVDGLLIPSGATDLSRANIVCVQVQADDLTIAGTGETSRIEGGFAIGTTLLGSETSTHGGTISNFVFRGPVQFNGGIWEANNCTFLGTVTVNEGTAILNGCNVNGVASRVAGTAIARLSQFVSYPTGTWTLVFADTTP